MHCESMKNEQIPVVTPMCKSKLERTTNVCKSTKYNRSFIRHNKSTVKHKGLSSTRK